MLQKLTSEILSLFLLPFSLGHRPKVGLVLKGSVDDVRQAARRVRFLPFQGVEIIGYGQPVNPSCEFLEELTTIKFARIYASPLTHLESIGSLTQLRRLQLAQVLRGQVIPIDLGRLPHLERADLQWFVGAETIFEAKLLKSLSLSDCPISNLEPFGRLDSLLQLDLTSGRVAEVEALRQISSLRWLALGAQRKLSDFSGLSGHPALQFLWIEGCRRLDSLEWLAGMPRLETLRILDCGTIDGIEVLRSLPRLKHVHIHGSVKVIASEFRFLRELPNLESVFIKGLPKVEADYWAQRNVRYDLIRQDLAGW